ncbi:Uncharacterised protein [Serratia quinivorans]|uniref:Ref family recombination enhancement nuclease n=1 Tax=Serratia quinivorans TaxID=137545 RepID=UPI0021780441|nr:Ref family recombination enhancement nuclease [Serratia quinivorans]CAI1770997.1 Uncharacterised protein [Serratia quinivorans]
MKKADREYLNKLAELGCVACFIQAGVWGTPGEIHHTRAGQGMSQRSAHKKAICLCVGHHRGGVKGKHAIHAEPRRFTQEYGTEQDLLNVTASNL